MFKITTSRKIGLILEYVDGDFTELYCFVVLLVVPQKLNYGSTFCILYKYLKMKKKLKYETKLKK